MTDFRKDQGYCALPPVVLIVIKALVALDSREPRRPMPISEVSDRISVSISYLEQIFNVLRHRGFVQAQRGPGGGYMLAKESLAEITVGNLMRAFNMVTIESGQSPALRELERQVWAIFDATKLSAFAEEPVAA